MKLTTIQIVKGFPWYRIDTSGRVWSCAIKGNSRSKQAGPWRVLKATIKKGGYLHVCLSKDGMHVTRPVHRLVLEAFVGTRPEGMQCRHLDSNPANNRLENLQWSTSKINGQDKIVFGKTRGEKNGNAKLSNKDREQIFERRKAGETLKELGTAFGVHPLHICRITRGWK